MSKEIKDKFAVLYVQHSKFWTICDELDWHKSLKKLYRKHTKKISAFKAKHFPKEITIYGYCENDDIAHSDIDDAIRKEFKGKNVKTDSEGGGFYCYSDTETKDAVCAFLDKNFPDLGYSIDDEEYDYVEYFIPFINWADAEDYVKKEGIEVPEIFDDTNLVAKLKEFDDKINAVKRERHEFLKNIN